MLCSYVQVAALEGATEAEGIAAFWALRAKYETAPESLYGKTGRVTIVRLVKRFFDPATWKELPSDVVMESDQQFPVPKAPDLGVPCG